MNRLFAIPVVALAAATVVLAPAAARDRKPPRIVAAAMVDANGNFRADRVRLTYSERVRHVADRDGRYPFAVVGYRIRSIRAASGQTLLVFVAEKAQPDPNARPPIRYRRTRSKPVRDGVGNQAVAQLFRLVRAHRHAPPAAPVSAPAPAPAPPAAAADADRDGAPDGRDCAPKDASIRPGAPDLPDLSFVDTNCDGIDGTEADAVFVSKNGNDNNPGTKAKPKATIGAAVATIAAGNGKYVLAAAGEYGHLGLGKDASGVGVYGGYDPDNWSRRSASLKTSIVGAPEGVLADNATRVVLQNLSVQGNTDTYHWSSYGILAVNGSALTLERVTVIVSPATDVTAAIHGTEGFPGRDGGKGENGHYGTCDDLVYDGEGGKGGMGGSGAANAGFNGGVGGFPGYYEGQPGHGPGGGGGGKNGDPGQSGGSGADGLNGTPGGGGSGGVGVNLAPLPSTFGKGAGGVDGGAGRDGTAGRGGSGGGGGGGHVGLIEDELGNGGGGGGGGGAGGSGGGGGPGGAGSFGIYLYGSILVVESSSITAGNGAAGTSGGNGGRGGYGGARGYGGSFCLSNLGRGGRGGLGGYGGPGAGGGGGAGGPSIGIFKGGTSKATVTHSTIKIGKAGAGGVGGRGGGGFLGGPNGGVGANGEPGIAADIYPKS